MILFPCCKINLGLDVTAKRGDGYHELETVMLPVDGLCDILEIVPGEEKGAAFTSSGLALDCPDDSNLCLKAYRLMAGRYPIGGVRIHLHKIIPFGAGLGGGSADAAYAIKGLDRLFSLGIDTEQMESLAAELGSDTAFFIRNTPRLAQRRGEILSPSPVGEQLRGKTLVIVKPAFGISTSEAYAGIKPERPSVPLVERLRGDIGSWKQTVKNDFERHIFEAYPVLAEIKQTLYDHGALYASMSGSGSAVYGIFDAAQDRSQRPLHTPLPTDILHNLRTSFPDLFVYQQIIS